MKSKLALLLALILGVIAAVGVNQHMQNWRDEVEKQFKPQRVLVASHKLAPGKKFQDGDFKTKDITSESYVHGAHIPAMDLGRFLGREIFREVNEGDFVFYDTFRGARKEFNSRIDSGLRATTIQVDGVGGLSGLLKPGYWVDIIGTFAIEQPIVRPEEVTRLVDGKPVKETRDVVVGRREPLKITSLVLPNVKVLALDQETADDVSGLPGERAAGYSAITFQLTPYECMMLHMANEAGHLRFLLRGAAETGMYKGFNNKFYDQEFRELKVEDVIKPRKEIMEKEATTREQVKEVN